jgi:hypothetical protein
VELYQTDPLQFYISQKEASNEVKGNQLREKAKEMMASLNFRMPQHFKKFFELFVVPELQTQQLHDVVNQVKKDAVYQALDICLSDESAVPAASILQFLLADFQRADCVIVQARALKLLSKLSDLDQFRNDTDAQVHLM